MRFGVPLKASVLAVSSPVYTVKSYTRSLTRICSCQLADDSGGSFSEERCIHTAIATDVSCGIMFEHQDVCRAFDVWHTCGM